MRQNIPTFHKPGVPKQLTPQQRQKNQISIVNLLHPENGLGTEIRSHYDALNAETLDEDVIFIADGNEPAFDGPIFQGSTIENPNIS